jgi:CheY-like chemotaxis protein
MPGIDGVTLCRKVRENPSARPNYLILLTGMSDQQDIVEGLCAGADDYVIKPFNETGIFTVTLIKVAPRVWRSLQARPFPLRKASPLLGPVSPVDRL